MDKITALLAFLATLSLATERITEMVKGLFSKFLAKEQSDETKEGRRQAAIHFIAIAVGTGLSLTVKGQIATIAGLSAANFWVCLMFGAMASGGSGLWNSLLDIAREVNKQKEQLTNTLKNNPAAAATAAGNI